MHLSLSFGSRTLTRAFLLLGVGLVVSCRLNQPAPVSPTEMPELQLQLRDEPRNGDLLLRYAGALFAAGRCDSATVVARRGMIFSPSNNVAPLVVGQCQEQAGRYDVALAVYRDFIEAHPNARGVGAVEGREAIARRAYATNLARGALAVEDSLATVPADPQSVGVLPVLVAGDSSYQPLSIGLAELIGADLGLLQRFQMVERLQLQALTDELALSANDLVDETTAARVGRLVRAGRLVKGTAVIPDRGDTRLEATVVTGRGEVVGPVSAAGEFRDLIALEKELVFRIANQLGYQLTAAERERILENGTQRLAAFLAYSSGLAAEQGGDYSSAVVHFSQAVREDPGFTAAREAHSTAVGADVAGRAGPGDVTTVGAATDEATLSGPAQVDDAIGAAVGDVAGTQGEKATAPGLAQSGVTSNTGNPQPTVSNFIGMITVILRIPIPR